MRNFIDMLNESTETKPVIVESELLEEGVRDQIEAIVDRVLGMFSPKLVTYEAACNAIDRVNALTGGSAYFSYTKDQLLIGGKLAKEVAGTAVGVSLALAKIHALGLPLTGAIVAATTALVGTNVARITMSKRQMVKQQADRHAERSPAPAPAKPSVDDEFATLLKNIDRLTSK